MQGASIRTFLWGVVSSLILLGILYFFLMPFYSNHISRSRTDQILHSVRHLKGMVEEKARRAGSLVGSGSGITLSDADLRQLKLDVGFAASDGTLVFRGAHEGQVIILRPSMSNGTVQWMCIGGSARDTPSDCK